MHHAYIYEGALATLPRLALHARKQFDFTDSHDPDVHVLEYEKFGIDDSRALRDMAALKSAAGRALFVIGVASATTESQQALLKLFEEPQKGTVFVLLAPQGSVIATLRSRFLPYPEKVGEDASTKDIKKFLVLPYKARSAEITKLLKDEDGVRERVRGFLNGLESELYKHLPKDKGMRQGLEDIAKVRSYANDRSPSFKMLLEHLALTLPTLK